MRMEWVRHATAVIGLLLVCSCGRCESQSTTTAGPVNRKYVIMAPLVIYPGQPYNVSVSILQTTGPVDLITRLQNTYGTELVRLQSTFASGESRIITLQIPSGLSSQNGTSYSLTVQGTGGLAMLNESRTVYISTKTVSIFIQTDKTSYTPNQDVQFRVVTVYSDLKPFMGSIDVTIYDDANSDYRIGQWLGQHSDTGVFDGSFRISDAPKVGTWSIRVMAQNYQSRKTFTVTKYGTEPIVVAINTPSLYVVDMVLSNNLTDFPIGITAMYPDGLPMTTGSVQVNVSVDRWDYENYPAYRSVANVTWMMIDAQIVNGVANLTVSGSSLRDISPWYWYDYYREQNARGSLANRRIHVDVNVVDSSGSGHQASRLVQCTSQKYKLAWYGNPPSVYRRGLPFSTYVVLSRQDGGKLNVTALQGTVTSYCYIYRYHNVINVSSVEFVSMPKSDVVLIRFWIYTEVACGSYVNIVLLVRFDDGTSQSLSSMINEYRSLASDGIAFQLINSSYTIDDSRSAAKFLLRSTKTITSLTYVLLSKGWLIKSETLHFPPTDTHYVNVTIDRELAWKLSPRARILVWYVTPSYGELLSDALDFTVTMTTRNQVTATFSSPHPAAGDTITITVQASPGSYVGLLAADDKSSIYTRNDITVDTLQNDLFLYHTGSSCLCQVKKRRRRDAEFSSLDGTDTSDVFRRAGVVVITDASLYYSYTSTYYPTNPFTYDNVSMDYSTQTVLWKNLTIGADGTSTFQMTVPDQVKSLKLTAFAISPTAGLGIIPQPVTISVIRTYIATLRLPYSVVRGEEFAVQLTVVNYQSYVINVTVTLGQSADFSVRSPNEQTPHSGSVSASVQVSPVSSNATHFWIVPEVVGPITVSVTAASGSTSYNVAEEIFVQWEGMPQEYSSSVVAGPQPGRNFDYSFAVWPTGRPETVPGSVHISLTVVGDLISTSIDGLADLLHMPYGCGEQNMINFAPDVYILKYVRAIHKSVAAIEDQAMRYITSGYQTEMTYQRTDGSFSAFGNIDVSGSVWLTAFVAKCFHEAKNFIPLNEQNLAKSLNWLLTNQRSNGSFTEPPGSRVIYANMQSSAGGEPLTAYVLISLLENADNAYVTQANRTAAIDLSRRFLESQLNNISTNPYSLSIVCYALTLVGSSSVDVCLRYLDALATVQGDKKFWQKPTQCGVYGCYRQPADIEMTAYALLTYIRRRDYITSSAISKWVLAQRNSYGGFMSTQDTVVALQALAEFAEWTYASSSNQSLSVSLSTESMRYSFNPITATNALLKQSVDLPSDSNTVSIEVRGTGIAIVQLVVKYNIIGVNSTQGTRRRRDVTNGTSEQLFVLTSQRRLDPGQVDLQTCAIYTGSEPSGMCIMEIGMPTGYKAVSPELMVGQANGMVKKVEINSQTGDLVLYLDELRNDPTCTNVTLKKESPVSNVQPAVIIAYLYYNPGVRASQAYTPITEYNSTWCEQCPQCCECKPPDYVSCDGRCARVCDRNIECLDMSDETQCEASSANTFSKINFHTSLLFSLCAMFLLISYY